MIREIQEVSENHGRNQTHWQFRKIGDHPMVNEQKEENRIRNHRPLTVYRPLEGEEVSTKVFSGLTHTYQ